MKPQVRGIAAGLACLLLWCAGGLHAQTVPVTDGGIARVDAVEGTAFVVRSNGRQGILARGTTLQEGESINTARNSTVRLKFKDGSETVLRPETTLAVKAFQYQPEAPSSDNLLLNLLKGGMRAITGAIGKRGNQDAYRLQVQTATVGIRGTEYSVRLCQADCPDTPQSRASNAGPPVIARVMVLQGDATIQRPGKADQPMTLGQPIYAGDVLTTAPGAHALMVFRDDSRVTLNPASRMVVTDYAYQPGGSKSVGSMLITLLKGGLRAATGLIGKFNTQDVKFRTVTATIGIRGTVFDMVCAPSSSRDQSDGKELSGALCDESLFAQTRGGVITLSGSTGTEIDIPSGVSGRVDGPGTASRPLDAVPEFFRTQTSPEPESIEADLPQLFGVPLPQAATPGIFLTVHEGRVVLGQDGTDLLLDAGESAYAGTGLPPVRLQSAPTWMNRDPFLSSGMYSAFMCRR